MKISIELDKAREVLRSYVTEYLKEPWRPSSVLNNEIESIILGSHLTYRYILLTGLLAKVVNNDANPLALQKGADVDGAYDARSLCHKVIVPLETELFSNRLGASNEPFLNKPARFKTLSSNNAVRKGKDKEALEKIIHIFQYINSHVGAEAAFKDAIHFIFQREARSITYTNTGKAAVGRSLAEIYKKLERFSKESLDGESSVTLAGACLFFLFKDKLAYQHQVLVHPVNQAGSSSNEILDIDIYVKAEKKKILLSVEVKDKPYARQDVLHAISKAKKAGLRKILFVEGKSAAPTDFCKDSLTYDSLSDGFLIVFMPIQRLFIHSLLESNELFDSPELILEKLEEVAISVRCKDHTLQRLRDIALS